MDAGTDEYARMGKNGHTLVGLALELVKEGCHRWYCCRKLSPPVVG
ncbi:MAG: hypothetical protein IJ879_06865 [Muribaculaceae bacterium]|nr:hypothetical protein [Muribaculaceae bacterium]